MGLIERLRHLSREARNEYEHEVLGRSADALTKLPTYVGHNDTCEIMTHGVWSDPIPCTCGLQDLLDTIGE